MIQLMKSSFKLARLECLDKRTSAVWFAALGLFVAVAPCQSQGTIKIAFDSDPMQPPGTSFSVQQYVESGMWFRPLGVMEPSNTISHRRGGGQVAGLVPDNGTAYLAAHLDSSLVFNFLDSSLFGISALDMSGYSTAVPDFTAQVVGYRFDGSTVTANFSGSGINFQTFLFGPEFSSLIRVEIPNYGWSLDNLVVLVPEPGVSALLLLAGALAGWRFIWRNPK